MEIKISKINILLILSIVCFLCSCSDLKKSDYIGKSYPVSQKVTNRFFDAELTPIFLSWNDFFFPEITTSYAYDIGVVFRLDIKNNSNSNIYIDWNKTQYLHKGQLLGGLLFPGMDYLNRENNLPPDVIPAHFAATKVVIPDKLLYFDKTWVYSLMKPGENGIYLSINADGKEVAEKISVNISYVKKGIREKRFGDFAKEDIKTQLERLKKELERTKAVTE